MRLPALFTAACVTILGAASARADRIETVSFSLISSTAGPVQQTLSVPQFDPAQGTLNSIILTVMPNFQFVLEVFDSGAGTVSVTALDTLSFAGVPLTSENVFSGTIPSGQPIFTFMPPPVSPGPLTQVFGPNLASIFSGTGTVPFSLSLATPAVVQFSGPTTTSVLVFGGVSGTVTADYAFTPTAVPEPAWLGAVGLALIAIGTLTRRNRQP